MKVTIERFIAAMLIIASAIIGVIFNSEFACRMSVLIIMLICVVMGLREKKFVNPYILFSVTPFSLLIYSNISDSYMQDLSVYTWILAIINMALFLVVFTFTSDYRNVHKCIGAGNGRILRKNTYILLLLSFLPTFYTIAFGGMMPLASIFALFSSPAIVCALKSKDKKLIVFVVACFLGTWIGYVSKSSVLTFALAFLIAYEKYYLTTKKAKKRIITLTVIAVFVMIISFSFANQDRGYSTAEETVNYYRKYGNVIWDYNHSLLMPYFYLTTPWSNLQYVVNTQSSSSYGLWLLKPLLSYLQIDSHFAEYYTMKAYSNFNTFTFIACCFKDFGYWGSIISTAFLAFFSKKVYSRYLISRSPLDVACYVLLAQAVLEMFFSNEFYTQSFPFTIVIIMGMYKMLFCKGNEVEIQHDSGEYEIDGM